MTYYVAGLSRNVDRDHVFLKDSVLAFALVVCIVPLTLIIFALLGIVLEKPSITGQIDAFIERAIPYGTYAAYVKGVVASRVNEFTAYKGTAGIIGIVGLLVATTSLFSSMRTVLDTVYQLEDTESILFGKLRDLLLILLVLVFVLLSTTILPSIHVIKGFAHKLPFLADYQRTFLTESGLRGISFLLIFASFLIIYFAVPQQRLPRSVILVSSLSAAILWYVAKEAFGFYVVHVATLKRVYGAYSLIIVVAFWIYYTAVVFVLGAEIGQLYRERPRRARLRDARHG